MKIRLPAKSFRYRGLLSIILAYGSAPFLLAADWFALTISAFDPAPTATDLSALGGKPVGAEGPVRIENGHFVDGAGRRLRLFGVNFSCAANFPEHADADRVAARLATLGVNAVRHHHMDAHDIWRQPRDGTREVDPDKLDKLAYLISRLKLHGICSNINLHASRSVTTAEGFPEADKLPRYDCMSCVCASALSRGTSALLHRQQWTADRSRNRGGCC